VPLADGARAHVRDWQIGTYARPDANDIYRYRFAGFPARYIEPHRRKDFQLRQTVNDEVHRAAKSRIDWRIAF
jgi:hypothetical protein